MFKSGCPQNVWCYGMPYIAKVMQRTASHSGKLDGRTPIDRISGDTPDISEYMDFGFYDWVIYKNETGLGEIFLGRFLDVSHGVGSLMSYWIFPGSGMPILRSTAKRVKQVELEMDEMKQQCGKFDKAM